MSDLFYVGGGNKNRYYYKIKKPDNPKKSKNPKTSKNTKKNIINVKAEVSRISCKEYDDRTKNKNLGKVKPNIGSKVIIITKPYHQYNCMTGIVKRVLTNKMIHTRGHKVMLENGIIGRTLKVINI